MCVRSAALRTAGLLVAFGLVAVALVPGAAAYRPIVSDTVGTAGPVLQELRPVCAELLDILSQRGYGQSDEPHLGYEEEWLVGAPECQALRDAVQDNHNVYGALGHVEHCSYVYGVTCVAINHPMCDFAIMVATGIVYQCYGGLNPDN